MAQTKVSKRRSSQLITALTRARALPGIYGDDGVSLFWENPEIQRIVRLKQRALPLLIAHLNDKRLTAMDSNTMIKGLPVTVGVVCFDVLTRIVRHRAPVFDEKCEKDDSLPHDSVRDCVYNDYLVEPESFWHNDRLVVKRSVQRARQKWRAAYQRGRLRYEN